MAMSRMVAGTNCSSPGHNGISLIRYARGHNRRSVNSEKSDHLQVRKVISYILQPDTTTLSTIVFQFFLPHSRPITSTSSCSVCYNRANSRKIVNLQVRKVLSYLLQPDTTTLPTTVLQFLSPSFRSHNKYAFLFRLQQYILCFLTLPPAPLTEIPLQRLTPLLAAMFGPLICSGSPILSSMVSSKCGSQMSCCVDSSVSNDY